MTALVVAVAAAATTAIIGGAIAGGATKDATQSQLDMASDQAAVAQKKADAIEEQRIVEEKAKQETDAESLARLETLEAKRLKIEAQQFHIQTLASILKERAVPSQPYIFYETAPAKEETGLISQINKFIGGLF